MAKTKRDDVGQMPVPCAEHRRGEGERYTVGEWHGLPNYECSRCPFSTLDKAEMEKHWLQAHAPRPPRQRVVSQLVDRFGNPLQVEEDQNG